MGEVPLESSPRLFSGPRNSDTPLFEKRDKPPVASEWGRYPQIDSVGIRVSARLAVEHLDGRQLSVRSKPGEVGGALRRALAVGNLAFAKEVVFFFLNK